MPEGKPAAVLFTDSYKQGNSVLNRLVHLQETLGPVLGGRVYSRQVGWGRWLATLAPEDTLLFPTTHDRAGQERYRWEDQPDGTRYGYLVEDQPDAG